MGLVSFLQSVLQLVGLVHGALLTFKTLRANPYIEADGARMLRFWAVLSAFFLYSSYLEWAVSFWMPFYNELKLGGLIWLLTPGSSAPSYFFDKYLHPAVTVIQHVVSSRISPEVSSRCALAVSQLQPIVFAIVSTSLSKEELKRWSLSLSSQSRLVAVELEKRRRSCMNDNDDEEGGEEEDLINENGSRDVIKTKKNNTLDAVLLSSRPPLEE
jgi:hypothetical protein